MIASNTDLEDLIVDLQERLKASEINSSNRGFLIEAYKEIIEELNTEIAELKAKEELK